MAKKGSKKTMDADHDEVNDQGMSDVVVSETEAKAEPEAVQPPIPEIIAEFDNGFEAYPGEYHMVKLDASGNEIPGSDFSCHPNTYNRTFSKLDKQFRVKKSPKA